MKKWNVVLFLLAILAILNLAGKHESTVAFGTGEQYLYIPFFINDSPINAPPPIFGLQMYTDTTTKSKYHPFLLGSQTSWVRVPIDWHRVEGTNVTPDQYNWGPADRAVSAAYPETGGLNLIVTLREAPEWAIEQSGLKDGPIDVEDLDEFAEFAQAVVERYDADGFEDAPGSPVIRYWEIYNEPDAGPEGWDVRWGASGAEYAHMLSVVYPAIKAASDKAQVALGGIAYDWFDDEEKNPGPFVRSFLDDVLLAGGGDYFDIMNFHAYPEFSYYWTEQGVGLLEKTNFLRDKLDEYGYGDKPMILTEVGAHSNISQGSVDGEEVQSRYLVQFYTQAMVADLDIAIWWMLYDANSSRPKGLVTNNTPPIPKAAYTTYQTIVAELGTAHFVRTLSEEETNDPTMEAYYFTDQVLERVVYVAWLNPLDTTSVSSLEIPATEVTVRDIYGSYFTLDDEADGLVDGIVIVQVGGQPVFIEVPFS